MGKPELKPHQRTALEKMRNGTVLTGGVGSGKTPTSLFYFYEKVMGGTVGSYESIQKPMDLYVFTTARKRDTLDWQEWAAKLGISTNPELSTHGIRLVVESYNNMMKYNYIKDAFIILDEQRMVGSGAWTRTFLKMAKHNQWIMLSATPGDKWEDYATLFIANGFYKNISEYKREHMVYSYYGRFPKLERYLNEGRLVRLRRSILVEMPYERHTRRHIHQTPVEYNKELFERVVKKRWHVYENRPLKDISELFAVMRKVVNSDPSRLRTVRELLENHPRLIVFYNFDYELEMLRTLANGSISETDPTRAESISGLKRDLHTLSGTIPSSSRNELDSLSDSHLPKSRSKTGLPESSAMTSLSSGGKAASTISAKVSEMPTLTLSSMNVNNEKEECECLTSSPKVFSKRTGNGVSKPMEPSENGQPKTHTQNEKKYKSGGSSTSRTTQSTGLSGLTLAEWNGHKHEEVPDSERWLYLVQYRAGAEAWNCTTTDAIAFWSLTYSYRDFEQSQGRIDRLDTPFTDLQYYVLMSDSAIDKAISTSLRNKEDFNERAYIRNI